MVTWKRASSFIVAAAAAATLTACGTQPLASTSASGATLPGTAARRSSPPGTPGSPPQSQASNNPAVVVRLTARFSPSAVRLRAGQQFLLTVSPGVQARGPAVPAGCTGGTAAGGLLSVRCASGGCLYTAEHPGTATLVAFVRPHCSPGQMCPTWVAEPQLQVTVT